MRLLRVRHPARRRGHHQPAHRRTARRRPTRSTSSCSTPPSARARSTPTTPSSARACSSTSARSSTPTSRRSRSRSPCARSTSDLLTCEDIEPEPRGLTLGRSARTRTDGGSRPRVVLGVSGGIAAYKACELLRLLTESGHDVTVVPTASALKFVGAATWEALSGQAGAHRRLRPTSPRCSTSRLGQQADLVVVAPATADLLAQAPRTAGPTTCSRATLLTARCPVVLRAGDAHRDVAAPGDAGQRRDAARARRASSSTRRAAG